MMPSEERPTFQQIVCGTGAVRTAFKSYPVLHAWWQLILFLHGKPRDILMTGEERVRRVADGFRFYAWLYRVLGLIFLGLAVILAILSAMDAEGVSSYWAGVSFLGGCYLWIVSGLGYRGARAYGGAQPQSIPLLVSFMVMVVAFLSLFVAALSVIAHHHGWLANGVNITAISSLFVFGVGSYLIEIVYLVTEGYLSPSAFVW
jgi:hypothetical protein